MFAIQQANRILDWHENLMGEELPPEWMWHLEHELEAWFEEVDRKRKERFGSRDDDDDGDEPKQVVPLMQNELTKGRR